MGFQIEVSEFVCGGGSIEEGQSFGTAEAGSKQVVCWAYKSCLEFKNFEYRLFVTLESKGFQLSRTKMEFKECKFSKSRNKDERVGRPDGQEKGG